MFAFIDDGTGRHELTAYGIKPATAIKLMAALGTPTTYIYCKDKTLTLDEYIAELAVQEVFEALAGGNYEA